MSPHDDLIFQWERFKKAHLYPYAEEFLSEDDEFKFGVQIWQFGENLMALREMDKNIEPEQPRLQ